MIPAAGEGSRLGCKGPKALVELAGKPLLIHTLERFVPSGLCDNSVIIIPPGFKSDFENALNHAFADSQFVLVDGGPERQDSVQNGLKALDPDTEIVVIHDAARPFVTATAVSESIEVARQFGAATIAIPSIDTILESDDDQFLIDTPDRQRLWACQTPQTFQVSLIRKAHEAANAEQFWGTDDASLVHRLGSIVKLVQGSRLNFKITTQDDLSMAEQIIAGDLL